jgi:AmmeMemoRadiSam system protein B
MSDRPRLRPLECFPIEHRGQKLLALRDPSLLAEQVTTLPPAAAAVVALCDGDTSRDEICEEFFRRYRQRLPREALDSLLADLDRAFLLESDHFREHAARVLGDYARAEVRPPVHAGRSYPSDPEELGRQLDSYFSHPQGPGPARPGTGPLPQALIAPHVDFQRGGPAYAWAYRPLAEASERPEVIVVLGTAHSGIEHPFILTTKHFATPLGLVRTDLELVRALATQTAELMGGGADLFADEFHHRAEHSLEFQMVWLRHLLGPALEGISVLPILCGTLYEFVEQGADPASDERVGGFLTVLREVVAGRRVLWIAAADLAHVGPRYGDPQPLGPSDTAVLEQRDQATLGPVLGGDAAGWFSAIAAERDQRRVCGLAPIYGMLAAASPGAGRMAAYAQCPAESGSVVSIASIIYP